MIRKFCLLLAACCTTVLLGGCSMWTVDRMYCPPRRSEEYNNLQSVMDTAMAGMEYCAPLTGENQQTVQMADLDGDGIEEYLLFAKSTADKPLRILIFCRSENDYVYAATIEGFGTAFDQVEYVQMDGKGGLELVVGRQLSNQLLRSVSVYSFSDGQVEQLMTANYTKFLTCDMDADGLGELFVLYPGQSETDRGLAALYGMENGVMERSIEVNMSEPADRLKRIVVGKLDGGIPAVFAASAVEESAVITDVYAVVDGTLTNVTFSNESGTSVKTLRNYYVYVEDIDDDGVVEIPSLITMKPIEGGEGAEKKYLIRWYAMKQDGAEVDKMYTFHDYVGGWYLELPGFWASRVTVAQSGNEYGFYLWDDAYENAEKIMTVYAFTGQNREEAAAANNRFTLLKSESTVYAANLEVASVALDISREDLIQCFHLIHQDWKTGET